MVLKFDLSLLLIDDVVVVGVLNEFIKLIDCDYCGSLDSEELF